MSDWRQSDPGKKKPKPQKTPKPIKPKATGPVPGSTSGPPPSGGWRGKGGSKAARPTAAAGPARSWTGAAAEGDAVSGSSLRKWLVVGLLFAAVVLLTTWFVREAFILPERLPLYVFSVGQYNSHELLENPFGNSQREQLKSINTANIIARDATQNGNDNALSALNSPSWVERFEDIKAKHIQAGGPSGKVVAFYIDAYAAFSADDNLAIFPQGASPFDGTASQGLPLADALRNLASSVAPGAVAWVVLDLRLPPLITNLGDLDPQWRTAAERALSTLDQDLQDRLMVTLACDNGQQNWLAPEYSNSFFGHYFRQVLEGRYADTSSFQPNLTVAKFSKLLSDRVATDVSNRRYASQTPIWIYPQQNTAKFEALELVTIDNRQSEAKPQPTLVTGLLKEIDAQWQKDNVYQRSYRWDPLGYAKFESQLLALEEVALNQPDAFPTAQRLVAKAFDEVNRPTVDLQLSLIEDEQRDQYFLGGTQRFSDPRRIAAQLAQKLASDAPGGDDRLPSFWRPAASGEAAAKEAVEPAEAKLAPRDRPLLVWHLYRACATTDKFAVWEEVFRQDRLQAALAFAGPSEANWLEMYLLQRLASDIDWTSNNRNRPQACAKALAIFNRLQAVATQPEPEISWWLRDRDGLPPLEEQFLRGFDWLLANQTTEAIREFDQVASQLTPVEEASQQLAKTIAATHDALHAMPHHLAWLLKEYQFASEQDVAELTTRLGDLGRVAELTSQIYAYLVKRPVGRLDQGMLTAAAELEQKLQGLDAAFAGYVDDKTNWKEMGGASVNPQTFRRARIALLSPLLPLEARARLHENSLQFLKMELDQNRDQIQENTPLQRSTKSVTDKYFLKPIESQRERWGLIAKIDIRTQLESQLQAEMPAATNAVDLRSELLQLEYWQRVFAAAYGHAPSLHERLANASRADNAQGARWPWSAPWQRWCLSAANDRVMQVERLATASWGNGPFNSDSLPEDFFFQRRANIVRLPSGFKILEPAARLEPQFEADMKSATTASLTRLKSQQPKFGEDNQSIATNGQQRAPLRVEGEMWNAVAQVFMGTPQNRLPWLRTQPDDRVWVVDLAQPTTRETKQSFDAQYWSNSRPPLGTLAVRGNVRIEPIRWRVVESQQQAVELVLEQEPADTAIIRVRPPDKLPAITVLMLIDCSASMNTLVDSLAENEQNQPARKIELFDLVKKNANAVLSALREIHGRDAEVQLGLIPFGLEKPAAKIKDNLQMLEYGVYRTRKIESLSVDWFAQMEDTIDGLQASSDTPLYNSIVYACDIAKQERSTQKAFIYVFSDGVNYLNSKPLRPTQTDTQVRKAVADIDARLSIFHFDYFADWIEQQKAQVREAQQREIAQNVPPSERTPNFAEVRAREIFDEGTKQLDNLEVLGADKYGYYRSGEANKLLEESLASIPRSYVTIVSVGGSNAEAYDSGRQALGDKISIPPQFLPATLEVTVNGPFEPASIEVEALGGERLLLPYDSRGRFLLTPFETGGKRTCNQPVGGNLQSKVFVRTLRDRLETTKELGLELHFWNENPSKFTRRPRFLVAEVSQSNDPRAGTFVLADHRFTPETNYPEARLSEVPWPSSRQPVKLRVWAADSLPAQLKQIMVAPQQTDTLQLGPANIQYTHKGDKLIAEVKYAQPPRPEDRVVIICPAFAKATRKFDQDTYQETHEFTLPSGLLNQPAQLQFTSIADLQEAAQAREVTQCDLDELDLQN